MIPDIRKAINPNSTESILTVLMSHDCVSVCFECEKCGEVGFFTMEYGSYGKRFWLGLYKTNIKSLE